MKIIFFGTSEFAVVSLKAIVESKHDLRSVVTQPRRPSGRGLQLLPTPAEEYAKSLGAKVLSYEDVNSKEALNSLEAENADVFVVVDFGQILSDEVLEIPKFLPINIHASLLPKYRGAAPIQYAIINGERITGITIMKITKKLDSGDIIAQSRVEIKDNDDALTLTKKLSEKGAELLIRTLDRMEAADIRSVAQEESEATYAPKLKKEDGLIDWTKKAHSIKNLVRGALSWPTAYTYIEGKILKILKAELSVTGTQAEPGVITELGDRGIVVSCGQGALLIKQLQLEGKKPLQAAEFLRGYPIKEGIILG